MSQSTKCVKLKQFEPIRRRSRKIIRCNVRLTYGWTETRSRVQVNYILWMIYFELIYCFIIIFIYLFKISGKLFTSSSTLKQILSISETKYGKYCYVRLATIICRLNFESSSRTFLMMIYDRNFADFSMKLWFYFAVTSNFH